jgi:hypothetical protein
MISSSFGECSEAALKYRARAILFRAAGNGINGMFKHRTEEGVRSHRRLLESGHEFGIVQAGSVTTDRRVDSRHHSDTSGKEIAKVHDPLQEKTSSLGRTEHDVETVEQRRRCGEGLQGP